MALSSTFIQQMYVAYFGRPADPGGLVFYANFTEAALIQGFASSPESRALYGASASQAAISAVYQNLFNRPAEPAGLQAWYALLAGGRITLANMALSVLRGAANGDMVTINNKVAAANLFTSHLDTDAEIAGYSGSDAAAAARSYLKAVGSNPASLTAAQAGVDKAVTTVVTAGLIPVVPTVPTVPTTPTTPTTPTVPTDGAVLLTTGADTLVGGSGNDAFAGNTPGAFGFGDSIDGGGGTNTLLVTGETGTFYSSGITVANVQAASLSTTGGVNLDTTGWSGLVNLTVAGAGSYVLRADSGTRVTANVGGVPNVVVDGGSDVVVNAATTSGGSVTVGSNLSPIGSVTVNALSSSGNNIFVKGGSSVTVNASGTVTAMGTAATTVVAVNTSLGATANVLDVNANTSMPGTITSVTTSGNVSLNFNGSALAYLTMGRGVGNVTINNGGAGAAASHTLNLALDLGRNLGPFPSISDANVYDTINLSGLNTDFTYVSTIFGSAVKNLNLYGSATLDFSIGATNVLTGLQTVTMSGSGTVYVSFGSANPLLTLIDASQATGSPSVGFDPSQTRYIGGSGKDIVGFASTTVSKDVDLGDGDDTLTLASGTTTLGADVKGGNGNDTLVLQATDAAAITAAGGSGFSSHISGFETLQLSSLGTQVVDLALFGGSINNVFVGAASQANLTFNHFTSGSKLTMADSVNSVTLNGDFSGLNDSLNIDAGTVFMANYTATMRVAASGIENVSIYAHNGSPTPDFNNTAAITLQDADARTITVANQSYNPNYVTGNGYIGTITVALTTDSTAITSLDASGMPTGNLTWTAGALANAVVVKGSAQGADVLNLSAASQGATITLGTGANAVTLGGGADRVNFTGVNAASATVFTSISGMSAGDSLSVGGSVNAMGGRIADLGTSLLADLNAAAAGSASTGTPVLHWFTFGGDTYIVKDVSASGSFVAGSDMVVKLVGTLDLSGVGVAGGVITL